MNAARWRMPRWPATGAVTLAVLVAATGVIVAVLGALYHAHHNRMAVHAAFEARASEYRVAIGDRLRTYEYGLRGARGMVLGVGLEALTHQRFALYAQSLEIDREFPGTRGFGFIRRVSKGELPEFLEAASEDRGASFGLKQLSTPRDEHWVIQYIEPEHRNIEAIGLDIASDPERFAAARSAIHTGEPRLTAPMTLVQAVERHEQGFLLLLPIYRGGAPIATPAERVRATLGWSYAPLLLNEVLEDIGRRFPDLMIDVTDVTGAQPTLIVSDRSGQAAIPQLLRQIRLPVYGRTWRIGVLARPQLVQQLHQASPWVTLLTGALIAALLAALTYALKLPAERRRMLVREADALSRGVINASPQAIIVADADGRIVQANARVHEIFGYTPEQLQGQAVEMLLPDAHRMAHQKLRQGYDRMVRRMGARQDLYALNAQGVRFPVEVMLSPLVLGKRQLVVASIVDVTEQRAAIERLRESEARWRQLANAMPQLVWACTPSGACDFLSEQWARYTGVDEDQQMAYRWLEQVHPDDREALLHRWQQSVDRGTPFRDEYRLRRHDGAYRWFDSRCEALHDAAGQVIRWFGSNSDIHERRQAEEALRELNVTLEQRVASRTEMLERASGDLSNIINAMPSMVAYWDRDEINRFANLAYRDWFGVDPETLPGTHIRDLLGPELYALNVPHIRAALAGTPQQFERQIGGYASLARYVPDRDGDEVRGFYAFVTDVTEMRRATEAAEAANAAKSAFLANMSHEIRTPMNAVLNVAYLLKHTTLDAPQTDLVDKLDIAGRSLMTLINDILDLSKIEAGKMQLTAAPLDLMRVVNDAMGMITPQAARKRLNCTVRCTADLPARVVGDAHRLGQILNNLLGNAVKFTATGSVALEVSRVGGEEGAVTLQFAVIDTGIGMPEDVQAEVFKPFMQADSTTTRRYGGTGLGLPIVRRLVELMGGEVTLDSAPGEGSTFRVRLTLPIADDPLLNPSLTAGGEPLPEASVAGRNGPVAGARLKDKRILIVDDSGINLDIAERILAMEGGIVLRAEHGQAALDLLRAAPGSVDAVLMDIHMPVMDGLQAVRLMREDPHLQHLPVIALTADALVSERQRALDAGMNEFITKPFEPERVIAMLAAVLGAEPGAAAAAASTTDGAEPTPLQSAVVPDDALFAEADALARTGGDGTLLASLLNTFVIHCRSGAGLPQQIDALTEARAVQQQAHALRGTAANVGATAVAAAAGALERAARAAEADPAGMKAALLACHSAIEAFVPVADGWLATRPLMPVPPLGVPLTPDGMASLKRKLRARQLDALDDVARIIDWREHLGDEGARQLHHCLQRLDFEGALRQLESLRLMHAT